MLHICTSTISLLVFTMNTVVVCLIYCICIVVLEYIYKYNIIVNFNVVHILLILSGSISIQCTLTFGMYARVLLLLQCALCKFTVYQI